jgi:hypothetical protein
VHEILMYTDIIEQWEVEKGHTPESTKWQETLSMENKMPT